MSIEQAQFTCFGLDWRSPVISSRQCRGSDSCSPRPRERSALAYARPSLYHEQNTAQKAKPRVVQKLTGVLF